MIRELIACEFGVKLSEVSVGWLMKHLGFTPQRPLHRTWQQEPAWVERWRAEEYPKVAARAKGKGVMIFFADESGVRSDHYAGTTCSPRGITPVVEATGAGYGFNMVSPLNALGHFRFMFVETRVTATVFCEFLRRFNHGMERKVFLIVYKYPTHEAKIVRQFVDEHSERIELFLLSPYSPEINPDELAPGTCEIEGRAFGNAHQG